MHDPDIRDFSGLIKHQAVAPRDQRPLPTPRPACCTALTYGGAIATIEGVVTHRARGMLAFSADYPGWGQWTAWVQQDSCEPL